MQVKDVMTSPCITCTQDQPLQRAAQMMAKLDYGSIPIDDGDRLVGMLTDRDIVTRGLAQSPDLSRLKAGDLMSDKILYCREDDDCATVARNMGEMRVRRLPVVDADKRLKGMVSLGDLTRANAPQMTGEALDEIVD